MSESQSKLAVLLTCTLIYIAKWLVVVAVSSVHVKPHNDTSTWMLGLDAVLKQCARLD